MILSAAEPPPIIRFLRNPRMWPDYWEYVAAGPADADAASAPEEAVRVALKRTRAKVTGTKKLLRVFETDRDALARVLNRPSLQKIIVKSPKAPKIPEAPKVRA